MTHEALQRSIQNVITEITGVEVDMDSHLLSDETGITMEDFLYIFQALQERLRCPAAKALEHRDYTIFTIRGLADALLEDWPELHEPVCSG